MVVRQLHFSDIYIREGKVKKRNFPRKKVLERLTKEGESPVSKRSFNFTVIVLEYYETREIL